MRITVTQPAHGELWQPSKCRSLVGSRTAKTSPTDSAPRRRDERQRLCRGRIEPLRVVHDADEGSVFRGVGEQTQDRQADEEPVRRVAVAQTERGAKRIALRAGEGARRDPGTARRAAATPRTRAPSRTRLRPPGRCRTPRSAAPDSPATQSCRPRHLRAAPAPRLDPRAHSRPADPAPRTRCAGRAAAARKRWLTSPRQRRGGSLR